MGKVKVERRERSVLDAGCAEQVLESTVLLMSVVRLVAYQQPAWPRQTVSAAQPVTPVSGLPDTTWHYCQETSNQPFFRKNCQDTQQPHTFSSNCLKTKKLQKMTVGGRVGALWIGGLEPYMDEAFLQVS